MTVKVYKKAGRRVRRPRYLNIEGVCYVPPTDEQLLTAGYTIEEAAADTTEPTEPTDTHD